MTVSSAAEPSAPRPRLGWPTKALYGMSAMGQATKTTLSGLTLFFYTQLVGLDPRAVSTAIFIALIIDAFWDPVVGQFSDNTRTPLGQAFQNQRHCGHQRDRDHHLDQGEAAGALARSEHGRSETCPTAL